MTCYRVLSEAFADDVLSDWRKYCAARGMSFGGYPGSGAHTVTVISTTHRMQVTIGSPEGATPLQTLAAYLSDYMRRNPHLRLLACEDEQQLSEKTKYEGSVGFLIEQADPLCEKEF